MSVRPRTVKGRLMHVADFRDAFGRRRQLYFKTKGAAKDAEAEGRRLAKQGLAPTIDPDITLAEYVEKEWPAKRAAHDIDPGTIARQEIDLRKRILPAFGSCRFAEITRPRVREFLTHLLAETSEQGTGRKGWNRRKPGKQLARGTVLNVYHTLSAILSEAVEDQLILANPMRHLWKSLSKGKAKTARASRVIRALDVQQARLFATAAQQHEPRHWPYFATMMWAGLRTGEGLGLLAEKIDFAGRSILVDQQVGQHPNRRGQHEKDTKTGPARRVDLAHRLADVLRAAITARKQQAAGDVKVVAIGGQQQVEPAAVVAHRELRTKVNPGPWLFYPELGEKPTKKTVQNVYKNALRAMRRALEKAGLPTYFGLHALRHTFGNNLVARGVSLKYVQQQMGHASIQTTSDDYGDSIPSVAPGQVDALADAIAGESAAECNTGATIRTLVAAGAVLLAAQAAGAEGLHAPSSSALSSFSLYMYLMVSFIKRMFGSFTRCTLIA